MSFVVVANLPLIDDLSFVCFDLKLKSSLGRYKCNSYAELEALPARYCSDRYLPYILADLFVSEWFLVNFVCMC